MTDDEKAVYEECIQKAFEKNDKVICDETYDPNPDGEGNVNYNISAPLTILIQQTGRFVERFASDLIISIDSLHENLNDPSAHDGEIFLFGLRENGVDHNSYVISEMHNSCGRAAHLDNYYRKIYALRLSIENESDGSRAKAKLIMKEIRSELAYESWKLDQEKFKQVCGPKAKGETA